jgi:hypothetical protein
MENAGLDDDNRIRSMRVRPRSPMVVVRFRREVARGRTLCRAHPGRVDRAPVLRPAPSRRSDVRRSRPGRSPGEEGRGRRRPGVRLESEALELLSGSAATTLDQLFKGRVSVKRGPACVVLFTGGPAPGGCASWTVRNQDRSRRLRTRIERGECDGQDDLWPRGPVGDGREVRGQRSGRERRLSP